MDIKINSFLCSVILLSVIAFIIFYRGIYSQTNPKIMKTASIVISSILNQRLYSVRPRVSIEARYTMEFTGSRSLDPPGFIPVAGLVISILQYCTCYSPSYW